MRINYDNICNISWSIMYIGKFNADPSNCVNERR